MSDNTILAAVLIIIALIPLVLIYCYLLRTLRKEYYEHNKFVHRDDDLKYHLSLLVSALTTIGIVLLIEHTLSNGFVFLVIVSVITLVCVMLGVTFAFGRGRSLIADYSTIGSPEYSEANEYKRCRIMSGMMFLMAAFFIILLIAG